MHVQPPTKIPTNSFIEGFQQIVNTYGIPRYKEFNPAVFTTVSFPFLFGVMFGDIAHGFLLMLVGILLILFGDKLTGLGGIVTAKYLITMMGFFAFFVGTLYNDFASLPIEFFGGSCYSEGSNA